ncbi:MAG: carbon-nitrogen hydrolase family protein [Blastocatellia bacterium]|nr:carbon-nitrogen hydrolase family protein [Blastocatellia bacterium]
MAKTTTACVQMDCEIGNTEANRRKIVDGIRSAAEGSARLVIFPECALTGYCFDSLEEAKPFAEPFDGPSAATIAEACRSTDVYAIAGFIESDASNFYNAAMLVGPDGPVAVYRKAHIPYIGVDRFVTPGDKPFAVHNLPAGRVGMNICYDMSFPEGSRTLKLLGAELIVLATNWPAGAWRNPEFVINTRALENHVNFAAANRVGVERGWRFIGRSKIVDYNGDTLAEASGEREEILFAQIDFQESNNNRIIKVAGAYEIDRIADRRVEFYDAVTQKQE